MYFLGSDELKELVRFAADTDGQPHGNGLTFTVLNVHQITPVVDFDALKRFVDTND